MSEDQDRAKENAAHAALAYVKPGMKLGLGTGSTAEYFVKALAPKAAELGIRVCTTSERTQSLAQSLGLTVYRLDELAPLDLTVDGADELDAALTLIKGGGGALLREKIVANASKRMLVIADDKKLVDRLGAFALPVEVIQFGWEVTAVKVADGAKVAGCSGDIKRRMKSDGSAFVTDNGNYILDCAFGAIADAKKLANVLAHIPGVVEHGLFIEMANIALIGEPGGVRALEVNIK